MLDQNDTVQALIDFGFELDKEIEKTRQMSRNGLILYVKVKNKKQPLVIHPNFIKEYSKLSEIFGVYSEQPLKYYHNSGLTEFPEQLHQSKIGKKQKYGLAFGFKNETALKQFVKVLLNKEKTSLEDDLDEILADATIPSTEREALIKARIGQGKFRRELIEVFNGSCPLSQIDLLSILKASHIKPWRDSSDKERLDKNNGLLLVANADALFDAGLISFDDSGKLLLSKGFDEKILSKLGVEKDMQLDLLTSSRREYMAHHRESHGFK